MGSTNAPYIMTLVNSIIGVSILAMPFCFKQCGIVIATMILLFSNFMTRLSCHYLLKSSIMTRRRTFELLAFHTFGNSGKTVIELSIILLMIGTCIAFFVVMGDLGPAIIGPLLHVEYSNAIRPAVLIGIAICVVLPLGLLKNVDSLSTICTASFIFYLLLVLKVFVESMDNLFSSSWLDEVQFWRPAGVLQCLPIFSMALSCQTQLLEIFESIQNGTLERMNTIVKYAINLCTSLYMAVGFFGYIAYYKQAFSGNLLMSFSSTNFSEFVKLGFVLSIAVTFPMVIFPCRASLHSLLFKRMHTPHYELVTGGGNHIPEAQFKCITFCIITSSLIVGLLAPNIEIVLGLLGSTIGVIICILCPPLLFISISSKATTEKVLAQLMCALGFFIMFMGTYANLYLTDPGGKFDLQSLDSFDNQGLHLPQNIQSVLSESKNIGETLNAMKENGPILEKTGNFDTKNVKVKEDQRVEPPIPMAPEANKISKKLVPAKIIDKAKNGDENYENIGNNENSKVKEKISILSEKPVHLRRKEKLISEPKEKQINSNVREINESEKLIKEELNKNSNVSKPLKNNDKPVVLRKDANEKLIAGVESANNLDEKAKEKPPLPLLKAQNNSVGDNVKKTKDNQKDAPKMVEVDREKRDLNFVEKISQNVINDGKPNLKSESSVNKIDSENHLELLYNAEDEDVSFVKNVVSQSEKDPFCDKNTVSNKDPVLDLGKSSKPGLNNVSKSSDKSRNEIKSSLNGSKIQMQALENSANNQNVVQESLNKNLTKNNPQTVPVEKLELTISKQLVGNK